MNYICIHSDNCLFSWVQILQHLYRAEILQCCHYVMFTRVNFCHHIMLTRVNFCCLIYLSSFRLSVLVVLTMLFTVKEHKNIFSFFLSHNININHLTVAILLHHFHFETHITTSIKSQISIITSVSFICIFCVQYWHWLQSYSCNDAHDCEKYTASSSASVTSAKCVYVAATASLSLSSEEVDSLHTSADFIFFFITATLLTPHSHDFSIALICLCCLQCSKVIVTLSDHKCRVMKNIWCSWCFKSHKVCNSICKMLMKHCVWLTVLLDSDWVQCSSQQIIHCCCHHIWEKEHRQRADLTADELYQSD